MSPLFLIMRGKDVSIPKGTAVMAYVDGDREIVLAGVPPHTGAALTNAEVLKLKEAGLGDPLIIEKIRTSPSDYHLETSDLIELKHAGLSEAVIGAMLDSSPRPANGVKR